MTHDDLLKKIQSEYEENKHFRDEPKHKPFVALRAVVELHKPREGVWWISNPSLLACSVCEEWMHDGPEPQVYPCSTIQAIEKALS